MGLASFLRQQLNCVALVKTFIEEKQRRCIDIKHKAGRVVVGDETACANERTY